MIARRFEIAAQKLGFGDSRFALRTDLFVRPIQRGEGAPRQLSLF
jgi:hypothetical protein